jgi:PAS domain S-box-containing protein
MPLAISQESIGDNRVTLDLNIARWIKAAPAMVSSTDFDGRLIAVSDVWLEKLGYASDEVIGRQTTDFMTSESRQRAINEVFPEFSRGGLCENIDCRMVRKDGNVIDVLLSAASPKCAPDEVHSLLFIIVDVTVSKRAERLRIESEALYRSLVEDQSDFVSLFTPLGELLYVNQAYARIHGRRPEEMIRKSLFDFVSKKERAAMEARLRKLSASAEPLEFESQVASPDGKKRWVAWSNRASKDGAGTVTAIHSVGRDIQRRVAAEQRIVESETRYRVYRQLAENSNDMKMLTRHDGRGVFVSPACRVILGYEPSEMLLQSPLDLIHPEDLEKVTEHLEDLGEPRENLTYRMRRKDGRYVWVESYVRMIDSDSDQPPMRLIVVRDVEQRIAAEKLVQESEARFRLLAENISDAIIFRPSPTGDVSYVSPAIRTLLGYEPDEFAKMAARDFVHPEDIAGLIACYASLSSENKRASNVHRARHANGNWVWVEIALTWIGGALSPTAGVIGALRDVSHRRREAEALEQARDEAQTANRIKTEFLANMSHELRTPLTGMLGVHEILSADASLNERQLRLIKLAEQCGRMLLLIVNDILDYSKMEAGKLRLASIGFSTANLIGSSVSVIAGLASAKRLDVRVVSDEKISPYLVGDEDRLRQILLNLLNNAVKFTKAGHIALNVERLEERGGSERIRFSVSDTGIGIPPDKIGRLFQRFSQIDGSSGREHGGSGLGLAIVKRLVDLMEGELGVSSAPGEGSTFWFIVTLPVAERPAAPDSVPNLAEAPPRTAKILVAEDNEVNQEIIRGMLESRGHRVDMVANGVEAILAVEREKYDLVLMDIQMPGIDGVGATKRIRALPGQANRLPIIAMTANVLEPEVAQFLAAGMDDHVGKPFSRQELFAVVARWLTPDGASALANGPNVNVAATLDKSSNSATQVARLPIVDEAKLEGLIQLIGGPKLDLLLEKLAEQLAGLLAKELSGSEDPAILMREAHKLASSSAMMGFVQIAQGLATLEDSISAGEDWVAHIDEVRLSGAAALDEISRRRQERARGAP